MTFRYTSQQTITFIIVRLITSKQKQETMMKRIYLITALLFSASAMAESNSNQQMQYPYNEGTTNAPQVEKNRANKGKGNSQQANKQRGNQQNNQQNNSANNNPNKFSNKGRGNQHQPAYEDRPQHGYQSAGNGYRHGNGQQGQNQQVEVVYADQHRGRPNPEKVHHHRTNNGGLVQVVISLDL